MLCFHKFNKVDEDGYQYCKKCGKAFIPPCKHNWILKKEISCYLDFNNPPNSPNYYKYIYECSKCKEIRIEKTE